jgi:hypothetical protein
MFLLNKKFNLTVKIKGIFIFVSIITVNLSFLKCFRDRSVTVPSPFRDRTVTVPSIKKTYLSFPFLPVPNRPLPSFTVTVPDHYRYRFSPLPLPFLTVTVTVFYRYRYRFLPLPLPFLTVTVIISVLFNLKINTQSNVNLKK